MTLGYHFISVCPYFNLTDELEKRLEILHSLQIEDIDNYVSLFDLKMTEFYKIGTCWSADNNNHGKNRIVYFSQKLNVREEALINM